jgi:uncharacterized protein YecE (DUF72 family)
MIRVGTSGFSFKDWRGTIYPADLDPKDNLIYYQERLGFDCVEINATYYTLLSDKSFAGMERKTGEGFEFVVKAYRGITHDPFDKRLGDKKPDSAMAMENIEKFLYSIHPIKEKNKLGAVLLQFPVFFYPTRPYIEYLMACKERFRDIPLVVEFRNRAWAKPETFNFLRKNELSYCSVDEPSLPRLMPFINEVTSDIGYLRFHGRNTRWFNATVDERYNYQYSDEELRAFIPEIKEMNRKSEKMFVFFNNCHAGFAVKNALSLLNLLNKASE